MNDSDIKQREAELRREHPEVFSDPECRPDEIFVAEVTLDMLDQQINLYKKEGLASARVVPGEVKKFSPTLIQDDKYSQGEETEELFYKIFMNLREFILYEHKRSQPSR